MKGPGQKDSHLGLWSPTQGEQSRNKGASDFKEVNPSPNYAENTAKLLAAKNDFRETSRQKAARALMSKNYFGIKEYLALYGQIFNENQFDNVPEIPWNENLLTSPYPFVKNKTIAETHFAFLGMEKLQNNKPLTIIRWRAINQAKWGKHARFGSSSSTWYNDALWANKHVCNFKWHLMPLEPPTQTKTKPFRAQADVLPLKYRVATAIEEATKVILYFRRNGKYLNQTAWGRCSDKFSLTDHVLVGCLDNTLRIGKLDGNKLDAKIGLATVYMAY